MFQSPPRPAPEWGDLVRAASPHEGPWPRISVWHGGADKTVIPSNAKEIIKQWTDVHGLPMMPSVQGVVDGYPRQAWVNGAGDETIESYAITNMAHGTPVATGEVDGKCGAAGPFLLEVGISSSFHIAKFFGLTEGGVRHAVRAPATMKRETPSIAPAHISEPTAAEHPHGLEGEVLEKDDPRPDSAQAGTGIDIGAIINKALRAAGLIKNH
jgi:hypothetical protein